MALTVVVSAANNEAGSQRQRRRRRGQQFRFVLSFLKSAQCAGGLFGRAIATEVRHA